MIVRNEKEVLARCLETVKGVADEIVIVDTGSTDNTVEIASRYTDKVYHFEWCDDFSAARNHAFSKATKDYILWLDADDVLLPKDKDALLNLKATLTDADVVYMKYVLTRSHDGTAEFSFYRERLIKNCPSAVWVEPVHEVIIPFGRTAYSDVEITHKKECRPQKERNLKIIEKHLQKNGSLSPRLLFYYARELSDAGRKDEAASVYIAFIDGGAGWFEDKITACLDLSRIYQQKNEPQNEINSLLKSLAFAPPRAECACLLGEYFLNKNDCKTAGFWFETALTLKPAAGSLGFVSQTSYTFTPAIWLAVVHDRLGNLQKANEYNELAGSHNPNHPSYISNKEYFAQRLKHTKLTQDN